MLFAGPNIDVPTWSAAGAPCNVADAFQLRVKMCFVPGCPVLLPFGTYVVSPIIVVIPNPPATWVHIIEVGKRPTDLTPCERYMASGKQRDDHCDWAFSCLDAVVGNVEVRKVVGGQQNHIHAFSHLFFFPSSRGCIVFGVFFWLVVVAVIQQYVHDGTVGKNVRLHGNQITVPAVCDKEGSRIANYLEGISFGRVLAKRSLRDTIQYNRMALAEDVDIDIQSRDLCTCFLFTPIAKLSQRKHNLTTSFYRHDHSDGGFAFNLALKAHHQLWRHIRVQETTNAGIP
mmetsp:Transcript_27137/g.53367  ORF Transcript_27137/g.53367 Transcript_27137/m.53367 type:complete len:286 (+) Transcript_27137:785-1642(+)